MGFIGMALVAGSLVFGYTTARQFVRNRLRYVDAIQKRRASIVAGVLAAGAAALPFLVLMGGFLGMAAAAAFGASVTAGVRAGARDIRGAVGYIEGP